MSLSITLGFGEFLELEIHPSLKDFENEESILSEFYPLQPQVYH